MQVIKGIWCMREQYLPGHLSPSPVQDPRNEAIAGIVIELSSEEEITHCIIASYSFQN